MTAPSGTSATASEALPYSFFKPCVSLNRAKVVANPRRDAGEASRASVRMRRLAVSIPRDDTAILEDRTDEETMQKQDAANKMLFWTATAKQRPSLVSAGPSRDSRLNDSSKRNKMQSGCRHPLLLLRVACQHNIWLTVLWYPGTRLCSNALSRSGFRDRLRFRIGYHLPHRTVPCLHVTL